MGEREHTQLNAALTNSSRIKAKEKKRCHRATQNRIIPRVPALHSRHGHTNNTTNRHRQTIIDMSTALSQSEQNICMAGCMHARIKPVRSPAPSLSVAYLPTKVALSPSRTANASGGCCVPSSSCRSAMGQVRDSTRRARWRVGQASRKAVNPPDAYVHPRPAGPRWETSSARSSGLHHHSPHPLHTAHPPPGPPRSQVALACFVCPARARGGEDEG